uniref:Fibronectin type-III domain-containing protein n=1 Tax=Knipowitschia caucasica TaxID=637954 RepID=A0AAV2KVH4_KNICA
MGCLRIPCPPENLLLERSCDSEVILFSWANSNNSNLYKAKAIDSKGEVLECLTEDNSCYFTQTHCGRHYYFSVYSMSGTCHSQSSPTVDISTAPCMPKNPLTSADCHTDAMVSKWDLAEGAVNYTVEAYGNEANNSYHLCTTHSNSCSFQNLTCGSSFTIYITAHDQYCSSPRMLAPVANAVPCTPVNVIVSTDCEANSIAVNWNIAPGAIVYRASAVDDQGNVYSCYTLDLTCTIDNLHCSTNYSVSVFASNLICNSSISDTVRIETVACAPSNITSTLDCANNEALITWTAEPRMKSFTATALDQNNRLLSCSSTTTSCTISDLECDQRYSVTVGNHDGICPTINSETVNMDSMACGPSVAADMDCGSQVLMASWEAVADAEGYEVQLSDGTVQKNFSITNPAFTSNNLLCGKTYTLNVRSVIDGCVTHATQVTASQAPCPPTSVEALAACPQTSANVTWQTSEGALSYEVTAVSSSGAQLQCNSTGTSCQLGQLLCGETYSITATALDGQCESQSSAPTQLTTEPCAPSSLAVSVDCASNSALLSWHSSPNAASYAGTGVSESGHTVSCAAGPDLSCSLDQLQCGEEYRFTVTASDGTCQSAESQAVLQSTAPCAVTSVSHTVECTSDSLLTSWTPAQSALNYTVRAENVDDGSVLSCKTEQSGCVLDGLPCGEQYTVTVTPSSSSCVGQSSEAQRVNTAPCVPSNIVAEIQCSDNSLHSSWDKVPGATSYLATLSGDGGFYQECPSRVGFCSFSSLECAQSFTLNVTGENDRCNSSATLDVQSAPCDPTDVTASLDCVSGVALVSWTASAGALSYTVLAQSNNHEARCGTDTTSCELPSLICGEAYAVIVLAADNTCNSSVLTTLTITTAPCPPVLQDFSLDCTTNVAVVPWVKDEDAQSVLVSAVSSLGHSTTCSSDNSSCVLSDLQCGNSYTVTAVAKGVQCKSKPSAPLTITTAPCTPENIDFTNSCETGIAIVTWDDSLGRESFRVSATSATDVKTCLSDSTDCSISSMLCGQLYNVSVYAIAAHCNSSVPAFTQIQTAPCAPEDVAVSLLCDNNTGSVSWSPSPGAVSYTVKALGRSGQAPLTCSSDNTSCDIPNMQCGETYRFTVTPFSLECQGYDSREMEYLAGPCPPSDFTVDRQCSGNVAVVSWNPVPKAEYYEASALELVTPHTHNCSSSSTTCSITDLHCGETVAITVQTRERGCWSQPNQAFLFEAVICPPTGLTAVTNCSNNDITVSWDSSPKLGVTYYVDSAQLGASSQQFSSSSTSHVITGLQCGQLYTLQVSAQYQECTSAPSSTIQAQTAPCPPTGLEASTDCGTSSVTLSWTQSSRATDYTATFTGANGDVTSCSSNSSSCTARLDCSQQYTAALTASDDACSSSIPATLIFNSAPCLPDNVVATLDCDTNSFSVSWDGNLQDGPFTAQAIGSDGSRVSCSSALNSCSMNSLKCGLQYSIVVTTADVDCGEITDSNYKAYSAPCKPEAISLDLDCLTNEALVTWEGTGPDQEQEVIARDIRGNTISCISNTTQCAFTGLTCGLSYSISVVGRANTCTSTPTHGPMLHTAPCLPSQVKTTFDCATGVTIVTWDAANGATSYIVEAQGNLGHSEQCTGADSNCAFASLACGQDYNITVQAQNSECTSAVSETVQSATGNTKLPTCSQNIL